MRKSKKLGILSLGTAALTLGSIIHVQAQVVKAETLQNLNLRTGPSTAHSIILTIKKGSVVEVIQNDGSWAYV
ncbi:MAG: SH3 domain-containing protein, partial [Paraclostridium sp.]